jgi:hypothetical protein
MDKPDKPYGEIRFDVIQDHLNKYKALTEREEKEIVDNVNELRHTFNYIINNLKGLIIEYFSDELQLNETASGAMRRNQIRKELLEFAHKKV